MHDLELDLMFTHALTGKALTAALEHPAFGQLARGWGVHALVADDDAELAVSDTGTMRLTLQVRTFVVDGRPTLSALTRVQLPAATAAVVISQPDGTLAAVSRTGDTAWRTPAGTTPPVGPHHRSAEHDRARRLLGLPRLGPEGTSAGELLARWWHQLVDTAGLGPATLALRPDLALGAYARVSADEQLRSPTQPATVAAVLRQLIDLGPDPELDRAGVALIAADGMDALPLLYRIAVRPLLIAGRQRHLDERSLAWLDGPSSAYELYPTQAPAPTVPLPPRCAAAVETLHAAPHHT